MFTIPLFLAARINTIHRKFEFCSAPTTTTTTGKSLAGVDFEPEMAKVYKIHLFCVWIIRWIIISIWGGALFPHFFFLSGDLENCTVVCRSLFSAKICLLMAQMLIEIMFESAEEMIKMMVIIIITFNGPLSCSDDNKQFCSGSASLSYRVSSKPAVSRPIP